MLCLFTQRNAKGNNYGTSVERKKLCKLFLVVFNNSISNFFKQSIPALSCPDELSFKALMHPLCTSSPSRLRSVSDLSTSSASLAIASNL